MKGFNRQALSRDLRRLIVEQQTNSQSILMCHFRNSVFRLAGGEVDLRKNMFELRMISLACSPALLGRWVKALLAKLSLCVQRLLPSAGF